MADNFMNRVTPFMQAKSLLLISLIAGLLSACDSIPFVDTTPDYKSANRAKPLEVPPDLTSLSTNDTYSVPNGTTTYSDYSQVKDAQTPIADKILPNPDNVHLERAGSQRWLVVQAEPEKIWPVIREFWSELGFAVRVENPNTGVMETEWVDPSSITKDEKGNYLDKFQGWLDKLNTLNNRQKFRTRIDRGSDAQTTEIYLSHRSVSDSQDDGIERVRTSVGVIENGYKPKLRTKTEEARSDAEDIDAELLRRLMVRLGVEENKSRSIMASDKVEIRAQINPVKDSSNTLTVNDPFDRAWRRVGLALDRIGFVIEDRDRSKGVFYVRYSDLDVAEEDPKSKKGLLDKLKFWGDDDKKDAPKAAAPEPEATPETAKKDDSSLTDKLKFWQAPEKAQNKVDPDKQYRITIDENSDGNSIVSVSDKDGNNTRINTANRIINLLFEQLK